MPRIQFFQIFPCLYKLLVLMIITVSKTTYLNCVIMLWKAIFHSMFSQSWRNAYSWYWSISSPYFCWIISDKPIITFTDSMDWNPLSSSFSKWPWFSLIVLNDFFKNATVLCVSWSIKIQRERECGLDCTFLAKFYSYKYFYVLMDAWIDVGMNV